MMGRFYFSFLSFDRGLMNCDGWIACFFLICMNSRPHFVPFPPSFSIKGRKRARKSTCYFRSSANLFCDLSEKDVYIRGCEATIF